MCCVNIFTIVCTFQVDRWPTSILRFLCIFSWELSSIISLFWSIGKAIQLYTGVIYFLATVLYEATFCFFFRKRRYTDANQATNNGNIKNTKLDSAYTIIRKNRPLLDDDSLTELGITGFLDSSSDSLLDDGLDDIFPTPSPQHDFRNKFSIHKTFKSGNQVCTCHQAHQIICVGL